MSRFGSKADIGEGATDVRFTPKSGHHLSPVPRVDILAEFAPIDFKPVLASIGHGLQPPQDGGSAPRNRREGSRDPARDRCQVFEDAERLIAAWNERQALRAPVIFSPTIGAAIKAGY